MMTVAIPEQMKDLLSRPKKAFAFLALVKSDGTPQVTPIWFDFDGTYFIFNTARGRVKDRIMKKHPAVAFTIPDPANPYRYLQVSGRVVVETEEGARAEIEDLNEKYHGRREYPVNPGEVRVTYKVLPERVQKMG
jgi:PPOX class probable F420-dependent enzyme